MFSPSEYKKADSLSYKNYSEDDIMHAKAQVEKELAQKERKLRRMDEAWAIISTIFAIISTSVLLAKNWVEGILSYAILGILIAYVMIFLVLCTMLIKKPDSNLNFKAYSKAVKIFKALANIAFLVLAAMTMASMVKENDTFDFSKWVVFIGNALLAVVKLVIAVVSLASYISRRHIAKHYSVQVTRYVDGKQQRKTASDRRKEKKYR